MSFCSMVSINKRNFQKNALLILLSCISATFCQNECENHVRVLSCPKSSLDWQIQANERCVDPEKFHCLITENYSPSNPETIECCMSSENISEGHMPRYNTLNKKIQEIPCNEDYFMPKVFASNKYREKGVENCNHKKTECVDMDGMKAFDDGNSTHDRMCYCDYKANFIPEYPIPPNTSSFFQPHNHCVKTNKCDTTNQELNMVYECVSICKDGEWRPENEFNCIPIEPSTTPSVVIRNGSTEFEVPTTMAPTTTTTQINPHNDEKTMIIIIIIITVIICGMLLIVIVIIKRKIQHPCHVHCCPKTHNVTVERVQVGNNNTMKFGGNEGPTEVDPLTGIQSENGGLTENTPFINEQLPSEPLPSESIPLAEIQVHVPSDTERPCNINLESIPLADADVVQTKVTLKNDSYEVEIGHSVTINCDIDNKPEECDLIWKRKDVKDEEFVIKVDNEKYSGGNKKYPHLIIKKADMTDQGYYSLCVKNTTSEEPEFIESNLAYLHVHKATRGKTVVDKQYNLAGDIKAKTINIGNSDVNLNQHDETESSDNDSQSSSSSSSESSKGDKEGTPDPETIDLKKEPKSNIKVQSQSEQVLKESGEKKNNTQGESQSGQNDSQSASPESERESSKTDNKITTEAEIIDVKKEGKLNLMPHNQSDECRRFMKEIANNNGFTVRNVCGDGNCMFRAVALQNSKLKMNRNGDIDAGQLREIIVDFLQNNDETPQGELYSSFFGEIDDQNREEKWREYLKNMRKNGTYGDERILKAISHRFCVSVCVLSTASPDRFIEYKFSEDDQEVIHLGFIHNLKHYVCLEKINNTQESEV